MKIVIGILLFIGFMALMVFMAHISTMRSELESKNIPASYFFIWYITDFDKFKNLIKREQDPKIKAEYQRMFNWCWYSFLVVMVCVISCIILISTLD